MQNACIADVESILQKKSYKALTRGLEEHKTTPQSQKISAAVAYLGYSFKFGSVFDSHGD